MLKFLLKLLERQPKRKHQPMKVDPTRPCWRCGQVFQTGALTRHNCQHGYDCVMLGWRCSSCRILCGIKGGTCPCFNCMRQKNDDCPFLKECLKNIAEGREPFEGFNQIKGEHEI